MKPSLLLVVGTLLWSWPSQAGESSLPAYTKAFNTAFERLGTLGLADTQTRISKLGAKGQAFAPKLAELRTRQNEVNDLIVKAVQMKKQAPADKLAAETEAATAILRSADQKGLALAADIKALNEQLTAAGAPLLPPEPPRDPNARD